MHGDAAGDASQLANVNEADFTDQVTSLMRQQYSISQV